MGNDERSMKKHPVYIKAQIGRHSAVCLVDTGSKKCVLPRRLNDGSLLEAAECLFFAANGTTINVVGEKTLNVQVGNLTIPTRSLVSDNVTEPMLGVNWLGSNRVIWDFAKDVLLVNGRKFELVTRESRVMCRMVVAIKNTVIERSMKVKDYKARSVQSAMSATSAAEVPIVPGKVEMNRMNLEHTGCVWTTEANELRRGLSVARTIMPEKLDMVPVLVLNSSNVDKKVAAHTILLNL